MGSDTTMIALDSNAMTYWIQAMGSVAGPPADPCCHEKIALVRIFFWMPSESCFHYTPTVEAEYLAIKDQVNLNDHRSWTLAHISGVNPLPDLSVVDARAGKLKPHHAGEQDCRIVAECELASIVTLLTCDSDLLKNLANKADLNICLPSTYWQQMAVTKGACPSRMPHATNPLSECTWWRW